jgi:hypothetical protein
MHAPGGFQKRVRDPVNADGEPQKEKAVWGKGLIHGVAARMYRCVIRPLHSGRCNSCHIPYHSPQLFTKTGAASAAS